MSTYTLNASLRDNKHPARRLVKQGVIPSVVYGPGFPAKAIQIQEKEFVKVFREAGTSQVILLDLEGSSIPTIIHELQRNSLTGHVVHLDFYHITKGHVVSAHIPLEFIGVSLGVKDKGGTLVTNVHEIEVQGLPEKLPASLEVDISSLQEFGDEIILKDIVFPEGVKPQAAQDLVIASLLAPARQEEVTPPEPPPTEEGSQTPEATPPQEQAQ